MASAFEEHYDGWSWVSACRYTYTYDANGHRLSELTESDGSGEWVNYLRKTYAYNTDANLISFWNYRWSGDSWTLSDIPSKYGPASIGVSDGAGNTYTYTGYNFTLTRRLIETGIAFDGRNLPVTYSLSQNYPNPFNPSTTIKYELPHSAMVRLSVFDMLGREASVLVNERKDAGVYEVKFEAAGLSSGVYFYRLQAGDLVQSKKLVIVK
jgi:hypothetical protein